MDHCFDPSAFIWSWLFPFHHTECCGCPFCVHVPVLNRRVVPQCASTGGRAAHPPTWLLLCAFEQDTEPRVAPECEWMLDRKHLDVEKRVCMNVWKQTCCIKCSECSARVEKCYIRPAPFTTSCKTQSSFFISAVRSVGAGRGSHRSER